MPWERETWIDDDGSLTTGTPYDAAHMNNIEDGIEEKAAEGPEGPQGEKGDTGAEGPKGAKGDTGAEGAKGAKGDTGETGPKGETGAKGEAGSKGEKGDTGAEGGTTALQYLFNTNTEVTDPGKTKLKVNNANPKIATVLSISATEVSLTKILAYLQVWDDSTTTGARGTIVVRQKGSPGAVAVFTITGALVEEEAGEWLTFPVVCVKSSGAWANEAPLLVEFSRTGDKGATGGEASVVAEKEAREAKDAELAGAVNVRMKGAGTTVDGHFMLAKGTGGLEVQDSGWIKENDGTLANNSDAVLPSQKAVKTYVDAEKTARIADVDAEEASRVAAVSAEKKAREEADALVVPLTDDTFQVGLVGAMQAWPGVAVPVVAGAEFKFCDESSLTRSSYPLLFSRLSVTTAGDRESGSKVVKNIPSTTGLRVGMPLEGLGFAAGTTIEAVNSGTQLTLSKTAESTGTAGALVFIPYGFNSSTTFKLPGAEGRAVYGRGPNSDVGRPGASDGLSEGSRTPKHTHEKGTLAASIAEGVGSATSTGAAGTAYSVKTHTHAATVSGATASANPPYLVIGGYIIRTK